MNVLRYLWLGGVLGVFLSVTVLLPCTTAEANPEPGKVTFKSAHTNYEYEVGKDAQGNNNNNQNNSKYPEHCENSDNDHLNNNDDNYVHHPDAKNYENNRRNPEYDNSYNHNDNSDLNDHQRPFMKQPEIANDNFAVNILTTTTASTTSTSTTFRPRLIYPGWTPQNLTQEPKDEMSLNRIKREDSNHYKNYDENNGNTSQFR